MSDETLLMGDPFKNLVPL